MNRVGSGLRWRGLQFRLFSIGAVIRGASFSWKEGGCRRGFGIGRFSGLSLGVGCLSVGLGCFSDGGRDLRIWFGKGWLGFKVGLGP